MESPFKRMWREEREKMIEYSRMGARAGAFKAGKKKAEMYPDQYMKNLKKMKKRSFDAKLKYANSVGERMRSPFEVEFSEILRGLGYEYEYEKRICDCVPDFVIGEKIVEIVGIPYAGYWRRLEEKLDIYRRNGFNPIVWDKTEDEHIKISSRVETDLGAVLNFLAGEA